MQPPASAFPTPAVVVEQPEPTNPPAASQDQQDMSMMLEQNSQSQSMIQPADQSSFIIAPVEEEPENPMPEIVKPH